MQVNFKESENEIGYSFQKQNDEYYPDKLFETENEIIEMYISKDEKRQPKIILEKELNMFKF